MTWKKTKKAFSIFKFSNKVIKNLSQIHLMSSLPPIKDFIVSKKFSLSVSIFDEVKMTYLSVYSNSYKITTNVAILIVSIIFQKLVKKSRLK